MERTCPRCGAMAGDGAYCKECKFFVGLLTRSGEDRKGGGIVACTTSEEAAEQQKCIRCGSRVRRSLLCTGCKSSLQYDKIRSQRRW